MRSSIQSKQARRSHIFIMAVNKKLFIYVYQKFPKCPAFGIFKIHIGTLLKGYLEKGKDVQYCSTENPCWVLMVMNLTEATVANP